MAREDSDRLRHSRAQAREWIFVAKHLNVLLAEPRRYRVQNAISSQLSEHGFNFYPTLVADLLHEFDELGVWKAVLTHLLRLRILYAHGDNSIQTFNER